FSSAACARGTSRLPAVTAEAWRKERREKEGRVMGGATGGSDKAQPQERVGLGGLSEARGQGHHFFADNPSTSTCEVLCSPSSCSFFSSPARLARRAGSFSSLSLSKPSRSCSSYMAPRLPPRAPSPAFAFGSLLVCSRAYSSTFIGADVAPPATLGRTRPGGM